MLIRLALFAWLAVGACSRHPTAGFGELCDGNDACESGHCASDGSEPGHGRCTRTCGPETPCPDGWSCSALTSRGVALCARGSGIPDLQLNAPRR